MAENKTFSIDLFDYALAVDGPEPITINVGADLELTLRRSHTGAQVVAFNDNETKRVIRMQEILADDKLDVDAKDTKLGAAYRQYIVDLLRILSVDPDTATLKKAAEAIVKLPMEARNKVLRTVGTLAGVVDEDGNPFPSTASSATLKPTNG